MEYVSNRLQEPHTLLGPGAEFEGKLFFQGVVRIDGKFRGEIQSSDTLIIGEKADVEGDLKLGSLVIEGTFRGNINTTDIVTLRASAKVNAQLAANSLEVNAGAIFNGQCNMSSTHSEISAAPVEASFEPPPRISPVVSEVELLEKDAF